MGRPEPFSFFVVVFGVFVGVFCWFLLVSWWFLWVWVVVSAGRPPAGENGRTDELGARGRRSDRRGRERGGGGVAVGAAVFRFLTVEDAPEHVARDGRAQDVARELERGLAVVDARRALEDLFLVVSLCCLFVGGGFRGEKRGGRAGVGFSVLFFPARRARLRAGVPRGSSHPSPVPQIPFIHSPRRRLSLSHLHDRAAAVDLEHLPAAVGAVAEAHLDDLGKLGPVFGGLVIWWWFGLGGGGGVLGGGGLWWGVSKKERDRDESARAAIGDGRRRREREEITLAGDGTTAKQLTF